MTSMESINGLIRLVLPYKINTTLPRELTILDNC